MQFPRPTPLLVLGIVVEIAVRKRRRVERVEQLLKPAEADLNGPLRRGRVVIKRIQALCGRALRIEGILERDEAGNS